MSEIRRPTTVTVVAVLLLVLNALALILVLATSSNPAVIDAYEKLGSSVTTAVTFTSVSCGIVVIASIGMLMGQNWGRLAYVGWFPVNIILSLCMFKFQISNLFSIAVYILLFSKAANDYFKGVQPAAQTAPPPPLPPNSTF